MSKLYTVIGRFQPLHKGHVDMINKVLAVRNKGDRVLILVGSSNKTRSLTNPLTYEEREQMILREFQGKGIEVQPLRDYDYNNDKWEHKLHDLLEKECGETHEAIIVGSNKEGDYLLREDWAWGLENLVVESYGGDLSASRIRKLVIDSGSPQDAIKHLTKNCRMFLLQNLTAINFLISECKVVSDYKESWSSAPFPPTFMATDAVVRDNNGKFLLIKRGGEVGTGDLALAGGFLEQELTHEANMKKELQEETTLNLDEVPHEIVTSWLCDAPNRAIRGRMTTYAFLVQLDGTFEEVDDSGCYYFKTTEGEIFEVTPNDDASGIAVLSLAELESAKLFNDHAGLIDKVLQLEEAKVPYTKNF